MLLLFAVLLAAQASADDLDHFSLPPRTLLHMGQKPHMLENDRQGTIAEDTWNRNIMGRETHFGLVPWRRGLYGGSNVDSLEQYANRYFGSSNGKPRVPWLMRITLKKECTMPAAVTDLATDQKYLKWLFENAAKLAQYASICLNLKSKNCSDLIVGTQAVSNGREENLCDDLMQEVVLGSKARVVRDTEWQDSWYVRDRTCIEKLEAGPDILLEELGNAHWDNASRQQTYSPTTPYGLGNFAILLGALKDSVGADSVTLDRLRAVTAASDIEATFNEKKVTWIREAGPAAVDAYRRCKNSDRLMEFREYAQAFEEKLHLPEAVKYDERLLGFLSSIAPELNGLCR